MSDNRVILIGEKENFLIRVLVNKLKEAGTECVFVRWSVNDINAAMDSEPLVIMFMDEGAPPSGETLHYLVDRLAEENSQMMIIGETNDLEEVMGKIPKDLVFGTFSRPVDNAEFVAAVTGHLDKVAAGEFKKSILIVDDDPNYMSMVREWLKDTYKVTMVASGMQAITWLGKRGNKADLILLDHEMPVTSGPKVLEMLRSEEETRNIPVIFLTGKSDKESVMAVVALKPEGYFLKTIDRKELLEKLEEFFILHK